jgi:hypothetical protein
VYCPITAEVCQGVFFLRVISVRNSRSGVYLFLTALLSFEKTASIEKTMKQGNLKRL